MGVLMGDSNTKQKSDTTLQPNRYSNLREQMVKYSKRWLTLIGAIFVLVGANAVIWTFFATHWVAILAVVASTLAFIVIGLASLYAIYNLLKRYARISLDHEHGTPLPASPPTSEHGSEHDPLTRDNLSTHGTFSQPLDTGHPIPSTIPENPSSAEATATEFLTAQPGPSKFHEYHSMTRTPSYDAPSDFPVKSPTPEFTDTPTPTGT